MEDRAIIIIDYSGISISSVVTGAAAPDDEDLLRHIILNQIRMYRTKYKQKYGEIVIVADAGGNWRKKVYPEYKGLRKVGRDESKFDWDTAFKNINKIWDEIVENTPYKTIKQWGCEADDAIAELVLWTQEFGNHEPVMIVSADKDFKQLHRYKNVSQYSPITKKEVKVEDPILEQKLHILVGDAGDGVPSVLDDDTQLIEGRKKNVLSAKKKKILLEDPKALGDDIYRNYLRNKKMIVLTEETECPMEIREEIIEKFENQNPKIDNKGKMMPYLLKNNCRGLMEHITEFLQ